MLSPPLETQKHVKLVCIFDLMLCNGKRIEKGFSFLVFSLTVFFGQGDCNKCIPAALPNHVAIHIYTQLQKENFRRVTFVEYCKCVSYLMYVGGYK